MRRAALLALLALPACVINNGGGFTAKNTALTNCIMPSTGSASAGEPCNGVGP